MASIKRAVVVIAIHFFNRFADPAKDPDVRIAIKRIYRMLGRAAKLAYGIRQDVLSLLLANTGNSIRKLWDAGLLQLAYATLFRGSKIDTQQVKGFVAAQLGDEILHSTLLRKSMID